MKRVLFEAYWAVTRAYLRLRGAEVGRNVRCNGFPFVKVRSGGRLVIGDDVMINATRWGNAHVTAGSTNFFVDCGATLVLGDGVGISGSRIVAMERIEIGAATLIGGGCLVCDSDMHEVPLGSPAGIRTEPIRVGARVFIGAQSIILKGVVIGEGAVVGAGAVVSSAVGANIIVAGSPAEFVRPAGGTAQSSESDPDA